MTYKPEKGSRQPVVLYDKDDKAIDVSGIEELSSVKIDTGKIAGDLELVKDNQGRLYGKYEEAWIPVKVDSEGRPIIASDVTVNAEGLVVDLGQIQQGPAGTEPWPVQLSGTIVTRIIRLHDLSLFVGNTVNIVNHTSRGEFKSISINIRRYAGTGREYEIRHLFGGSSDGSNDFTEIIPVEFQGNEFSIIIPVKDIRWGIDIRQVSGSDGPLNRLVVGGIR